MKMQKNVKWTWALSRAAFALVVGLAPVAIAGNAKSPPLKASLHREGSSYVVEIQNASSSVLQLTPLRLGGPSFSALSLYIYDPSNGSMGEAMATVFPGPTGSEPKRMEVAPGTTVSARFSSDEVGKYLAPLPKCYYLVTVYHEMQSGKRIWSSPSNALYECGQKASAR